ncbi:cis-3-chloroacrylic acid [Stagonosporopsis vannaccii]|nr:cis-3-chloroacrylic acid [Stagonosporopsis vannaccii]
MPLYEIHHSIPLSKPQRTALATHITNLHCSTFSAPSAFVNIAFHPTSHAPSNPATAPTIFVGGLPAQTNYILGHLRPRPNNALKLRLVVESIMAIWEESVRGNSPRQAGEKVEAGPGGEGWLDDPLALHNVFLFEDLVAGAEQGFVLPQAGKDGEWARENMGEFERRAREGDKSMGRLVREYKEKL